MSNLLRVFVRCPGGTCLPLEARASSTGRNIRSLVQLAACPGEHIVLIFQGKRLDEEKTLAEQGVDMDAEFTVERKSQEEIKAEENRRRRLNRQCQDLYKEFLRIQDVWMTSYESKYIPQLDLLDSSDSEDEDSEIQVTRKPAPSNQNAEISRDPLPIFWEPSADSEGNEYNDSAFSLFSSVEQAAEYLSQEGWRW